MNLRFSRIVPMALFLCPALSGCSHGQNGVAAPATALPLPANAPIVNAHFESTIGTFSGDAATTPGLLSRSKEREASNCRKASTPRKATP